jgi:glycosyltransferase involved in cell wall biosynthesis
MRRRRALVSQTRFPEIDRDSGSRRVDMFISRLLERDWSVTFLGTETDGEQRHARRLQQLGISTYAGWHEAEGVVGAGDFDLALLAFWEPASKLLPTLRSVSPEVRVVIDSIDVHFLRAARRLIGGEEQLDAGFGAGLAAELNAYRWADAVLTVSAHEARLLGDLLGHARIHDIPLAMPDRRSPIPFEERQGIVFIGNFRHLPNGEAVEYLCRDILPRLDPDLLADHPVYVIGSRLEDMGVAAYGAGFPNVKMVGWVPSVEPYLQRARLCVAPLLHGAGVKGKILESVMTGTPVVTTTIGVEGTRFRHGEHALIADTPEEFADGIAQLLTDRGCWQRLADQGHEAVAVHAPERVGQRFDEVIERVLAAPPRWLKADDTRIGKGGRDAAYGEMRKAIAGAMRSMTAPGSMALVVSRGDDSLLAGDGRRMRHFPQAPEGGWGGFPEDSAAAIEQLEALRERGARYFVVPSAQFWWLHHYGELTAHLNSAYRRIYSDDHLTMYDLAPEQLPAIRYRGPAGRRERVLVTGSYDPARSAPPARLLEELGRAELFDVEQRWHPRGTEPAAGEDREADWVLQVDAAAVLPPGFVDDFLGVASTLSAFGIERAQPAHISGPEGGPPVTERVRGVLAREVPAMTPLPVAAVRAGAKREGPAALVDAVPIALAGPIRSESDPAGYSDVQDVFCVHDDGPRRAVERSDGADAPRISVVIATYERPALLAACLQGFSDQTLPPSEFEVVVVDDGSAAPDTQRVLADFATRLPLTWTRIQHSGRSAAKNLAVLLARGDLVLFFDDDDRPAPDLLEQHVAAHREHPGEATAILGHTDWDPGLEISFLMHYLTDVDRLLFAYPNFKPGERINWQGFWEGRVSSKRSLHLRHGLHDQRLEYSIDVELAWRLRAQGIESVYHPAARSVMQRPIDFDEFCRRHEAKGRAQGAIASLHDHPEIREYTRIEGAAARWEAAGPELPHLKARIRELEQSIHAGAGNGTAPDLSELYRCYREAFAAHNAKGIADVLDKAASSVATAQPAMPANGAASLRTPTISTLVPASHANASDPSAENPELSIVVPVWSRTPELAEMAARTIERVWQVARMPTEVIVVDNGSPVQREFPARVHRYPVNRGVAAAWNTGINLARAPVIAALNSDCMVEPGWDEALYEAATTGRRIAFPYTDHCDGEGFRQPDQGGTAGWCFMLTRELLEELGSFDEWFSPAYGEDTDYWHRAWQEGVHLSPVPAARVVHARRSSVTQDDRADMLLLAHRYKYGWKHGVEPLGAPPYYNRVIVEYHGDQEATLDADPVT